ncbi:hypothetical protein F5883DRAFT_418985 [Diaporthe sp. PMI_573]|nr:hypothetical protein F5883DRAFT_418985 [Diaporthaceae sp. PMI_573]
MPRDKEQEDAYRSADLSVFGSGLFSDCVIKCGPKSWSLHRATLCSRSVWFEKTFTGLFTEGREAVVHIREQDPEAVELCLKYIYGGGT